MDNKKHPKKSDETSYLTESLENAKRLDESIAELNQPLQLDPAETKNILLMINEIKTSLKDAGLVNDDALSLVDLLEKRIKEFEKKTL